MRQPQLGQSGTAPTSSGATPARSPEHVQGPPLPGRVCGTAGTDAEALRRSSAGSGGVGWNKPGVCATENHAAVRGESAHI